ncbi:enterochelin esterase-like enzyme [Amycolatopsis sulphurea]|uniref:Enterochelin esterase-like enzyme n=1 Tax=Amycolatopsis sulphurea TaxID=76022 RepID=A0A2A9G476_9PSEU|nr:alpha/beta hydrolase-fold protein [Amycolatopsis sulphurea]PFG57439.1 enterochelin esterase-like enzyme [Amycolatopsis sulphurea]
MIQRGVDPILPPSVTSQARDLGPLESPLIWLTAAGAAVAVLAVTIALAHHRRFRRWGITGTAVLVLIAAVTAVNTYVGYVRTPSDLGRLLERGGDAASAAGSLLTGDSDDSGPTQAVAGKAPTGQSGERTEVLSLPDPAHAVPSGDNYVILPPGYSDPAQAHRRYPVVYLIHGYPFGGPADWLTSGDAPDTLRSLEDAHVIQPMIVVSVDLTAGQPSVDWECLNVPGGPQLETYLAQTIVKGVDQRYRTLPDRGHRALGGMSGGGFGALNIGLHHLGEFGTLLIALPYDDLNDSVGILNGNQAAIAASTPRKYLQTMPFPQPVSVMLAVGTGAPTDVATAHRIAGDFHRRGQDAVVHAEHGFNHTWHTARATLPYLLDFADQNFRSAPMSS